MLDYFVVNEFMTHKTDWNDLEEAWKNPSTLFVGIGLLIQPRSPSIFQLAYPISLFISHPQMSLKRMLSLDNLHTADSDSWMDVETKKAKRSKKTKTKLSASQPAELITDVINAVAGGIDGQTNTRCSSIQTESSDFCGSGVSPLLLMQSELKQLRETVNTLSRMIDQLTTALHADLSTNTKLVDSSYATVASAPSASTVHVTTDQHIRPGHSSRPNHEPDPVTAMYMDLSLKKRRANNIVITGMPPAQSPDHETKAVVL